MPCMFPNWLNFDKNQHDLCSVQIDCPQNKIKAIKLNKSLSVIIINLIMVKNQLNLCFIQVDSSAQLKVLPLLVHKITTCTVTQSGHAFYFDHFAGNLIMYWTKKYLNRRSYFTLLKIHISLWTMPQLNHFSWLSQFWIVNTIELILETHTTWIDNFETISLPWSIQFCLLVP